MLPQALPAADIGYATVVFYLGVNLIAYLDPKGQRVDALFEHTKAWAPIVSPFLEELP